MTAIARTTRMRRRKQMLSPISYINKCYQSSSKSNSLLRETALKCNEFLYDCTNLFSKDILDIIV